MFDIHLARLPDIRKVVFGFQTTEDMEKFHEEVVVPKMPLMSATDQVRVVFAVWKEQPGVNMLEGTWQYAVPKVDEMQGECCMLSIWCETEFGGLYRFQAGVSGRALNFPIAIKLLDRLSRNFPSRYTFPFIS